MIHLNFAVAKPFHLLQFCLKLFKFTLNNDQLIGVIIMKNKYCKATSNLLSQRDRNAECNSNNLSFIVNDFFLALFYFQEEPIFSAV